MWDEMSQERQLCHLADESGSSRITRLARYPAVFIGALFAVWFVGPTNIWPTNRNWVLFGDLRLAELHWDFYRHTSIFQFPIAGTPNYVRVEPHPILFHFPFKLLNQVLPSEFQFVGLSLVIFFGLQAFVAVKIFRALGLPPLQANIGAVMMTLTPLLIFRTGQLSHAMLGGHFLMLTAVYFYSKKVSRFTNWAVLLLVTSFLDMYLLVVMLTIFMAHSIREILYDSRSIIRQARLQFFTGGLIFLSLLIQGYFANPSALVAKYSFRLNIAAFFNPHFAPGLNFSTVLPRISTFFDRTISSEEIEGFAYLGLGLIFLVCFGCIRLFWTFSRKDLFQWGPISFVALFWAYVSVSQNAVIFRREFRLPELPGLNAITDIFRAAPRFIVLLYYLLIILGIVQVSRVSRKKSIAVSCLALLASLQTIDTSRGVQIAHRTISTPKESSPILDGEVWKSFSDYTHLKIYPVYDFHSDFNGRLANYWIEDDRWYPLVSFAARSQMTSNFGYLSRENLQYTRLENASTIADLRSGNLAPCTLYGVPGREIWNSLSKNVRQSQITVSADGYYIIASDKSTCG